jgi:hypothetical protein
MGIQRYDLTPTRERLRSNHYGIGVKEEDVFFARQRVGTQLDQLLKEPSRTVNPSDLIMQIRLA